MRSEDMGPTDMGRLIAGRLRGNTPKTLRALSFSFTPYVPPAHGQVLIRAHFFITPSLDDLSELNDMEGELYGDTTHPHRLENEFDFAIEVQVAPIGSKIYPREYLAWIDPMEAHRKA